MNAIFCAVQVWACRMLGGDAIALTRMKHGVSSYAWSPDPTNMRLLLASREPVAEEDDEDEEKVPRSKPWVIDRQQFKRDYAG
eukprot:SAG11_NODE_341_length_10462_cov_49.272990_9_plen_83_part_00